MAGPGDGEPSLPGLFTCLHTHEPKSSRQNRYRLTLALGNGCFLREDIPHTKPPGSFPGLPLTGWRIVFLARDGKEEGEGLWEERALCVAQARAAVHCSAPSLLTQFCGFCVLIPWVGGLGVVDSEAKEGTLPATAITSRVDPGAKHTQASFCDVDLPSSLSSPGVQPQHPRPPRHQDNVSLLALGIACLLMKKMPCELLGDQEPGMQLRIAGHGPEGKRTCWAWILICEISPWVMAGPSMM